MPTAANARCLLRHEDVINGDMGKELAEFLVEFLPFEEEPRAMIESARLVLQKDLISNETRNSLWKKGQRKNALLVGFLKTLPDELPVDTAEHQMYAQFQDKYVSLDENRFVKIILRLLKKEGQAYLDTIEAVMKKPSNQDVVLLLFKTINTYFESVRPNENDYQDIDILLADTNKYIDVTATQFDDLKDILTTSPELSQIIKSILILSLINESMLAPVFARTDAIGSLMRKKIAHIVSPLLNEITNIKNNFTTL